jgi:hypothetical protein
MKSGADIFFDSVRSGMTATKSAARTWEQSRGDVDSKMPGLAGPVFKDPIQIEARPGVAPEEVVLRIRHRGLTRLRIFARIDPPLRELVPAAKEKKTVSPHELKVKQVSFAPASARPDEDQSVLTVDVGTIPDNQPAGTYEGFITAANFELIIARLTVRVAPKATRETGVPKTSPRQPQPQRQRQRYVPTRHPPRGRARSKQGR